MKLLSLSLLMVCPFLFNLVELRAQTANVIPADVDTKDDSLINLGPIGVRVKTDHRTDRFPRSESNSGEVKFIFQNSPAQKSLKIGDVIVGVNGKKFDKNFTELLAKEIDLTEGGNGKLVLQIKRGKNEKKVSIRLKRIGSYASSWPMDCKKSEAILENACDWLVAHQQKNGRIEKNRGNSSFVLTSVTGLALLGSGQKKYEQPIVKIAGFLVQHINKKKDKDGHYKAGALELWSLNYAAIFLSEYYLRFKDKRVFPTLEFLNQEIDYRQFHRMSSAAREHTKDHLVNVKKYKGDPVPDYWFGHGLVTEKSNGYIHLGVNVANALVAWSLMERAGVNVDEENFTATMDYVEKACVSGAMGYASRLNQRGTPPDGFGRTGLLGVALFLQDDRPKYTKTVTGALNKLGDKSYYFSHATCVMGKAWGSLAMADLDPEQFRKQMDQMKGDFDLLRLSDGSFVSNPVKKNIHGKQDLLTGGSTDHHRWTTAFNALIFAIGQKKLVIAGGGK